MIFISGLREIILKGRKVRINFNIDKSTPRLISIMAVETMKKSNLDHEFLRYAFSPIIKPCAIIFIAD
jgi:hypothetical protein